MLTTAKILELVHPQARVFFGFVMRFSWLFIIALTDQMLLRLLLSGSSRLLLHCLFPLQLFHLCSLAFLLFLLDALALFLLPSTLSLLLLLPFCLLFCRRSLRCLGFGLRHCLSLSLSLCSGPLFCFCGVLSSWLTFLWLSFLLAAAHSEYLRNMWCGVNSSGGCSEHGLQECVGLLWLVARDNLGRLDVDLLSGDAFRELDHFDQEANLRLLLRDGLRIQLGALEESLAVACGPTRG